MGSYRSGDRVVGQHATQSLTATSDGTGTGQIAEGIGFAIVASNGGSANNIVTLPAHSFGQIIYITTGAACELRLKTGDASKSMNGQAMTDGSGAQARELALAASKLYKCHCISSTAWFVSLVNADGTVGTGGTPDGV